MTVVIDLRRDQSDGNRPPTRAERPEQIHAGHRARREVPVADHEVEVRLLQLRDRFLDRRDRDDIVNAVELAERAGDDLSQQRRLVDPEHPHAIAPSILVGRASEGVFRQGGLRLHGRGVVDRSAGRLVGRCECIWDARAAGAPSSEAAPRVLIRHGGEGRRGAFRRPPAPACTPASPSSGARGRGRGRAALRGASRRGAGTHVMPRSGRRSPRSGRRRPEPGMGRTS